MIKASGRLFASDSKTPRFLMKIEHAASKELGKDKMTKTISQTSKGLPRGIGKVMKGRGALPDKSYINFMDDSNKVFLGDKYSLRTPLLQGDPVKRSV